MDKLTSELERLKSDYIAIKEDAKSCGNQVIEALEKLFNKKSANKKLMICRIKEWDSIEHNIRKDKDYQFEDGEISLASVANIHDLIGIRVISLFKQDVEKIGAIIKKEFTISQVKHKADSLNIDQFGYQSDHYIIDLTDDYFTAQGWEKYRKLFFCEIQVRTLAQHTWAAVSHKLQYKKEPDVPTPVQRSIHRVSALLEIVDLEFERVLLEREDNRKRLAKERIWQETFRSEEPFDLDVDVLDLSLEQLLPETNRSKQEDFSELLSDLEKAGVRNDLDLFELIEEYMLEAVEEDRKRAAMLTELLPAERITQSYAPIDEQENRLWKGAYFTHTGLVREMLRLRQKKL